MRRQAEAPWLILAACIAAFCVPMGLAGRLNIWLGTGAAALTSVVLIRVGLRPALETFRRMPAASTIALGTVVGVAMSLATWWLYPLSVSILPPIRGEVETLYGLLRQWPGPVRAFPVLLLVVAAEEPVWRGVAIDLLSKRLGAWPAMLVAALLYVLPQVALGSPLLIVVAASCGLLWGALRVQTQSLAAPFFAHLVWDILVFVIFPVA